jgi:hypothetical protein
MSIIFVSSGTLMSGYVMPDVFCLLSVVELA